MNWASVDAPPTLEAGFRGETIAHRVVPPRDVHVAGAVWSAQTTVLTTMDAVPMALPLFRYARGGSPAAEGFNEGPPVLLLHGATAWSESFVMPSRHNLVQQLLGKGLDVWLLDWRGGRWMSNLYVDPKYRRQITFDEAARYDVWGALARIAEARPGVAVRIGGHCMGSNITAIAIGMGRPAWLDGGPPIEIESIQLSTIGLFYRQPWDGLLRASDFVLERIAALDPACPGIHSHGSESSWPRGLDCWPEELDRAYQMWPTRLLPGRQAARGSVRPQSDNDGVPDAFTRLSFMFGRVVQWFVLDEQMKTQQEFERQFGMMPLCLYIHAGQNVRRGFSAPFNAPERRDLFASDGDGAQLGSEFLRRDRFADLRRITLITGAENDLWHRNAIDGMEDWLRPVCPRERCKKHVVAGFSHQDLLWGAGARGDGVRQLYVDALS